MKPIPALCDLTVIQGFAQPRFNQTFFLYISFRILQKMLKFGIDIHLGKNNVSKKLKRFLTRMRADIQKKCLKLNLG